MWGARRIAETTTRCVDHLQTLDFFELVIRVIVRSEYGRILLYSRQQKIENFLFRFINCLNGVAYTQSCAHGLYFNAHTGKCDVPGLFNFCQVRSLKVFYTV